MTEMIQSMNHLAPHIEALAKVLQEGDKLAEDRRLKFEELLTRIHAVLDFLAERIGPVLDAELKTLTGQTTLAQRLDSFETALASMTKRLQTAEETNQKLQASLTEMIRLLR